MSHLTRRAFVAVLTAAMTGISSTSSAQRHRYDNITPFLWDAREVRNLLAAGELGAAELMAYVHRDHQSRTALVTAARALGLPESIQEAIEHPRRLPELGFPELSEETILAQIAVVEMLAQERLPFLVNPQSLQPLRVPAIPPQLSETVDNVELMKMIMADVLELPAEFESFQNRTPLVQTIVDAVREEEWNGLIDNVEQLLIGWISERWVMSLPQPARRTALYNLSAYCVPLVGFYYLTGRAVVAARRNRHRFIFS